MSTVAKMIKSLRTYIQDFFIEHWVAISIGAGGVLMTYLAALSTYIAQYGPLGWGIVGLFSVFVLAFAYALTAVGLRLKVRAKYDEKLLDQGSIINPLDRIFERKRIFINDFVLPSHVLIQDKTFVDCDLIGPANIYFRSGNQAQPIREPIVDIVWLNPTAIFRSGFIFDNCIFRNCSFQRITIFASLEDYQNWESHPLLNQISIQPSEEHLIERQRLINPAAFNPELPGIPPKQHPEKVIVDESNIDLGKSE